MKSKLIKNTFLAILIGLPVPAVMPIEGKLLTKESNPSMNSEANRLRQAYNRFSLQTLDSTLEILEHLYPLNYKVNQEEAAADITKHPLMTSDRIALLYKLANRVSDSADQSVSAKKQVLVGLGQSPAYLLEMIKLIDTEKGRDDRKYLNVAFSGSFYGGGCVDQDLYKKFCKLAPYYKSYLNKAGLSVQDLNKDDTEFIILEVCQHGEGLKSFLSFFDEYKKKPGVIYLQNASLPKIARVEGSINKILIASNDENRLTNALANADEFKDRLVPRFHFHQWKDVNPFLFQPEENATVVLQKLKQFVENRKI